MGRVTEPRVRKQHTKEAMHKALQEAIHGKARMCVPPQDDDTDFVLSDAIHEVLGARDFKQKLLALIDAPQSPLDTLEAIEKLCKEEPKKGN